MVEVNKTGFSQEWENCYQHNTQMSIWPWSDMISLVHRHCKQLIESGGKILELGCGAGANIPFFLSLNFNYFGIEGSECIVNSLHKRYPDLVNQIVVGDFTFCNPPNTGFDLIVDRAAVTHNSTESIKKVLDLALNNLKSGGIFVGVDWFSTNHTDFLRGKKVDDEYTRNQYTEGQFVGVGKVHFSDKDHLLDMFSKFEILFMEEKLIRQHQPTNNHQVASWNIVARKN